MKWPDIRDHYPNQWLLLEAIQARSESGKRILEDLAVLEMFPDSVAAMKGYQVLHRKAPERELFVFHTDREKLEVIERSFQLCVLLFRFWILHDLVLPAGTCLKSIFDDCLKRSPV